TALIKAQGAAGDSEAELLEAFQYDLLSSLDKPGGEGLLEEKIHKAWFGATHGGTTGAIVDAEMDVGAAQTQPLEAASLAKEAQWLAELNHAQNELDQARFTLGSLQRDLHEMWWKRGKAHAHFNDEFKWPYGTTQAKFDA